MHNLQLPTCTSLGIYVECSSTALWNSTANNSTGGASQLRKSVSMPTDCKSPSFPFFIKLKNQGQPSTLGPPCGGSEQYFMGFGHISTSTWCICHPWYVGRSINLCQCGLMLVLDLFLQFPFARWTKVKTHREHMALPPFSLDVIIYLFLIIYVKENMMEWQCWVDLRSFLIPFSLTD